MQDRIALGLIVVASFTGTVVAQTAPTASTAAPVVALAPMRPLPVPSHRPLASGRAYHVAPGALDGGDGSAARPWSRLQGAVERLRPGDTLYLHGGVYHEHVTVRVAGTPRAPITIRAYPGEVAILDGGIPAFLTSPATAWEPVPGGPAGEYRSTTTYPAIVPGPATNANRGIAVTGLFAASMVPLHGYKYPVDLRSSNEYWTVPNTQPGTGVYLGPGIWFDRTTQRIHARLAPTTLRSLGAQGYAGPSDPRTVPLVIAGPGAALQIVGSAHVRIQDLVIRGASTATVAVTGATSIELDGVTIYGGAPALALESTAKLRLVRSALRGPATPWSSRASLKYRSSAPYVLMASSKAPANSDWEVAYSEFTDGHDGLILDSIQGLRFHHNLVDNFDDDGVYLTFPPREVIGRDQQIFANRFSRIYTALAFAEDAKRGVMNAIGPGVFVFRNVFDLRDGTAGWIPVTAEADAAPRALLAGRVCGDHGSPTWDPLMFYNNTVITAGPTWRGYYGALLGVMGTERTRRRVFNNVFLQLEGPLGFRFQGAEGADVEVDGNLHWIHAPSALATVDPLAAFRGSAVFAASKKVYSPGWAARDRVADPRFVDLGSGDVRLAAGSPAIDGGVRVPASWPDPLRRRDRGPPDIGALPQGAPVLGVGPTASPKPPGP